MMEDWFRSVTVTVWRVQEKKGRIRHGLVRTATQGLSAIVASPPSTASVSVTQRPASCGKGLSPSQANVDYGSGESVGKVTFPVEFLAESEGTREAWFTLQPAVAEGKVTGELELRSTYVAGDKHDMLTVYLQCGTNLVSRDPNGLSDPYAYLVLLRDDELLTAQKSKVQKATLNPNFQQTFQFQIPKTPEGEISPDIEGLYIGIWDWDRLSSADFMGETIIPMDLFWSVGTTNKLTVHGLRQKVNANASSVGEAAHDFLPHVVMSPHKCAVCGGPLPVVVKENAKCSKCKIYIHHACKPFAGSNCSEEASKESYLKKRYPNIKLKNLKNYQLHFLEYQDSFLDELRMAGPAPSKEVREHLLEECRMFSSGLCGVCLKSVSRGHVCNLCGSYFHDECKARAAPICGAAGQLRVKIKYNREVILEKHIYMPLFDLLCKNDYAVLKMMNTMNLSSKEEIGRTLVRVFESQGKLLDMLNAMATSELQATSDVNTIFRSNSLTTKAYDALLKHMGMPYLDSILRPLVTAVTTKPKGTSCELDSSRLSHGLSLEDNKETLLRYCHIAVNCIFSSASQCPVVIRQAMGSLRDIAERIYTAQTYVSIRQEGASVVRYTVVSAFLFLRFICPAILNPQLFGLLDDAQDASTSRSFTLVAKTIQNIANLSEFGGKEPYMEPLNDFIKEQLPRVMAFVDTLAPLEISGGVPGEEPDGMVTDVKVDGERELSRLYRLIARSMEQTGRKFEEATGDDVLMERLQSVLDDLSAKHVEADSPHNVFRRQSSDLASILSTGGVSGPPTPNLPTPKSVEPRVQA